jgi:hypothetical protein
MGLLAETIVLYRVDQEGMRKVGHNKVSACDAASADAIA